jgi:cell division protein FtsA
MRQGYIVNIDDSSSAILRAVEEAQAQSGVRIRQATVSIGGISLSSHMTLGSTIISKADSEVTDLDVQKAILEAESELSIVNKDIIDRIPIEFRLDGQRVFGRPEGMRGIKLEVSVLFVTCLQQHIDDLIAAINAAGIDVMDVIASPLASSLVTLSERQRTTGCALVNIGAETVTVAVFENNNVIALHVFSIGSTDITNDIALGLKITLQEAEEIKKGVLVGTIPQDKVEDIIEARLTDIFELVKKYFKRIKRDQLLPAGVVITGGGSRISIVESLAKKILNLPTGMGAVHHKHKKNSILADSSWFVTYGLCMAGRYNATGNIVNNPFKKFFTGISQIFKKIGGQLVP